MQHNVVKGEVDSQTGRTGENWSSLCEARQPDLSGIPILDGVNMVGFLHIEVGERN